MYRVKFLDVKMKKNVVIKAVISKSNIFHAKHYYEGGVGKSLQAYNTKNILYERVRVNECNLASIG